MRRPAWRDRTLSAGTQGFSKWWLRNVLDDKGAPCGNCGQWRILKDGREVEECPECRDEAFDIFEVDAREVL